MACHVHEGGKLFMVCVTCDEEVCDCCIAEDKHRGHIFKTYSSVAKETIGPLEELTESPEYSQLTDQLVNQLNDLIQIKQIEVDHAMKTKEQLLATQQQINHHVDKCTETALRELDKHTDKLLQELDKAKEKVSEKLKKKQEFKEEVDRLENLRNVNPRDVIEQGRRLTVPDTEVVSFPKVSRQVFVPQGQEQLFGELVEQLLTPSPTLWSAEDHQHTSSGDSSINTLDLYWDGPEGYATVVYSSNDSETKLKYTENLQSVHCNVSLIHSQSFRLPQTPRVMKPTTDGNCWVKCHDNNMVKLVCTNGDTAREISCNSSILDVAVAPVTHHMFISFKNENVIKQVINQDDPQPVMCSVIQTGRLNPCFLCVTHCGDILVTLTNKTSWNTETDSITELARYNSSGGRVSSVRTDRHGRDLFFVSDGVSVNNSDTTVVVINATARDPMRSHLVVLDQFLNLKLRYIGDGTTVAADQEMLDQSQTFWITGVSFNQHNLLLVSESYSQTIQLLDPMCKLLKVLVRENQAPPRTLSLQADGDLWVGLVGGIVQVYKHRCEFTCNQ